jgi:hypothetical protein
MEQPTVRTPDRDAAMPARVTRKRYQQHLVACSGNAAHGRKAKPGFAVFLDRRPFLDCSDLCLAVPVSLAKRRPMRGCPKLVGENVDRSVGEIADPSGVVEVEMGRHDVPNIARAEAHIRDLPERRLRDVEPWPHHRVEEESEPPRLVDILDPEPGVDQDQSVVALDQEAVAAHGRGRQRAAGAAEQLPAARTERPAIEVVDTQGGDPPADLLSHICRQRPPTAPRLFFKLRLTG